MIKLFAAALVLGMSAQGLGAAEPPPSTDAEIRAQRQSLRARQTELTPRQSRKAETRLDTIQRKAARNPAAARQMLQIYEADQKLDRPDPSERSKRP